MSAPWPAWDAPLPQDGAGAERECMEERRRDHLGGQIERVTYHSRETGFAVLRVRARGHRDLVTLVGTMPSVSAAEWVEADGTWVVDREHGQQFKAEILRDFI